MLPKNIPISKEEVKRRKSAQINSYSPINIFSNNINTSFKSTSDLVSQQNLNIKSNSLFAYQELDQFSSFCDNESIPSEFLSDINKNSQLNNIYNNSTKLEENEQSDSSDAPFDNDMSEDDIIFRKYKHRVEKRKSALNSVPLYFKTLSSLNKPNEPLNNNNIYFSNSDKKMNKNDFNNNNFILNNNNCPNNIRRNSHSIQQFRNDLFFNNVLFPNQNIFVCPNNIIENNTINNINNMSNINNINNVNNISNINNINDQSNCVNNPNMNYLSRMPNQNPQFNYPNQSNFNKYNFIHNFPYNNILNTKKRNSLILMNQNNISQNQIERRSSLPLNSNFQNYNQGKLIDKVNLKEENPKFFLMDQIYCRKIQNKLENNAKNLKYSEEFYENIKPQLIDVIEHQFGNYVIQKFLHVLILQENKIIFEKIFVDISDKLYEICVHNYGTRVIQKTLEKLDNGNYSKIETEELNLIFKKLIEQHLYELCCDKNGNHVYIKLLKIFPKENNKNNFLYDELIKSSLQISVIQQGATLLQKAFDAGNEEQNEKLCEVIIDKIGDIINDKYGNYIIQTIFKLFKENINEKIYKYIDDNLSTLSKGKFSSNVIDKCIIKDYDRSNKLIQSILEKDIVKDIILDQFGNYVVQKALSIADKDTREKIFEQIKPMLPQLQKTNIGKKVYDKLRQNYKELF